MKRKAWIAFALCLMLFGTACAAKSVEQSAASTASDSATRADYVSSAEAPMAMEEAGIAMGENAAADASSDTDGGTPSAAASDADVRKIVYNASMDVTADDPIAALQSVTDKAKALGGYVSTSSTSNDDEGASFCSVTLKVPANRLDELVSTAQSVGKVNDYRLYSDDISLQYYDINARLENARAEERQLTAILEKCTTVEEILEVRESLASVRGDIESYQAQINLWDNLVSYATLDMSIRRTPKAVVSAEDDLLAIWKASDVWKDMTRGFQNSARWVVNALFGIGIFLAVAIIPLGILFLCIGLPILLHRRNKRKKRMAASEAHAAEPAQTAPATEPDAKTPDRGDVN